jgi:putative oxidoreductase
MFAGSETQIPRGLLMHAITRSLPTVGRVGLGLVFTVFGLNGFLGFLPHPPVPEAAGSFLGAMAATGYMFPLIKVTEIVSGVLLLSGRYVPLALTLLAPIIVNIVAFHVALAPAGLGMALAVLAAEIYLAWVHRDAFRSVLTARSVTEKRAAHAGVEQPAISRA